MPSLCFETPAIFWVRQAYLAHWSQHQVYPGSRFTFKAPTQTAGTGSLVVDAWATLWDFWLHSLLTSDQSHYICFTLKHSVKRTSVAKSHICSTALVSLDKNSDPYSPYLLAKIQSNSHQNRFIKYIGMPEQINHLSSKVGKGEVRSHLLPM